MGVAVSGWPLARAVSMAGELGVVSGTGLAVVFARRLQTGDVGGHLRRAAAAFPLPGVVGRVLDRYFSPEGKAPDEPFKSVPLPDVPMNPALTELTVLANFAEVWLAKAGHAGQVGINYLEKIQVPTVAQLYGAMLAGVDYVLVGAGIPRAIPGVLDALAEGREAAYRLDVDGAEPGETFVTQFDPAAFMGGAPPTLGRPKFLAIVSSATLAMTLARKSNGRVDGFVVEGSTAGGHNAPPRGPLQLSPEGEPVYGERDEPELDKIRALGLPFYLAGGHATPEGLAEARAAGAAGIQVGTAFSLCEESGIEPSIKRQIIAQHQAGAVRVFTDPAASPTAFPFKVVSLDGTLSQPEVYAARERVCDLGYLRKPYRKPDGTLGHRCSAEPAELFVRKGGDPAETQGRKCICNALFATIGLGQVRKGTSEPAVVTAGSSELDLQRFCKSGQESYTATDVIDALVGEGA